MKRLTGQFTHKDADTLSNRAANSDALNYPPCAMHETKEDSGIWQLDLYLEEEVNDTLLIKELGEEAKALTAIDIDETIDWVSKSLENLPPVEISRYFVHGSHDADKVKAHHHSLLIDANQAFGTGHHGTTSGCLEAITITTKKSSPRKILDLGTGSGILAFALAKALKRPILATDNDPIAVKVAIENARLNGVANFIIGETAEGFSHPIFKQEGPFDLIVANILAGPLRKLAYDIERNLEFGGTVILSGLLITQQAAVLSAYRDQGIYLKRAIHKDGWATLILG